jgi:ParB family chromosome partitioning protein
MSSQKKATEIGANLTAVSRLSKVELVPADNLKSYERNARTHSEAQIAQIALSIVEFGFNSPVLVDDQGVIIAGHGRVLAARKLGMTEVPCIELSHLTKTQRRAYAIADNQIALNAGWDKTLLAYELAELSAEDFLIESLGFEHAEIDALGVEINEVQFPELANGDKAPFQGMTFTLHDEQVDTVHAALAKAKAAGPFDGPNENSNGNALDRICRAYCEADE